MPYYAHGDTSGSIQAPIVLDDISVSGAVFLGNVALNITASAPSMVSGSSSFPIANVGLSYWDGSSWEKVVGNSGSLQVTISGAAGGVIPVQISSSAAAPVHVTGVLLVEDPEIPYGSSSITIFTSSLSSAILAASNVDRKQLFICNNTDNSLFIAFSSQSNPDSSFTVMLPALSFYELPTTNGVYSGPISGIWRTLASVGSASVTEISG